MATSRAPHLVLLTEVLPIYRRDLPMNDATLLDPNVANPLLDGEWLELNSSQKLIRGSSEATVPSWQVFAEKGRYDTQAIGKTSLLYIGGYEAKCDVVDLTSADVGDPLVVTNVTFGGQTRRGLKAASGAGQHLVFGWITKVIGSTHLQYWKAATPVYYTI